MFTWLRHAIPSNSSCLSRRALAILSSDCFNQPRVKTEMPMVSFVTSSFMRALHLISSSMASSTVLNVRSLKLCFNVRNWLSSKSMVMTVARSSLSSLVSILLSPDSFQDFVFDFFPTEVVQYQLSKQVRLIRGGEHDGGFLRIESDIGGDLAHGYHAGFLFCGRFQGHFDDAFELLPELGVLNCTEVTIEDIAGHLIHLNRWIAPVIGCNHRGIKTFVFVVQNELAITADEGCAGQ